MRLTTHVHVKAVKIQKYLYVLILVFNWSFDLISIFANLWYYYTVISSWWNYFQLSSAPPRATFRINDLLLFCRVFNWNSARYGSPNFGLEKLETASQVWKTSSDTWSHFHICREGSSSASLALCLYNRLFFRGNYAHKLKNRPPMLFHSQNKSQWTIHTLNIKIGHHFHHAFQLYAGTRDASEGVV